MNNFINSNQKFLLYNVRVKLIEKSFSFVEILESLLLWKQKKMKKS